MGIYVFDTEALVAALSEDARSSASHHDFGRDVIPRMVAQGQRVFAYNADEEQGRDSFYWRDIGVIDSYWEASMELLEDDSPFDLFDRNWPIYSYQPVSPPARVLHQETPGSGLDRSLLSPGVTISGARVDRSILSPGVRIERGAEVTESVLLDGVHVANVTVPQDYSVGVNAERDRMRFDISPNGVVVVAGITPRDDLERFLSPYSFEMAPMGAGSN
jgi:glucose-1-phosphate adenylyltransferase